MPKMTTECMTCAKTMSDCIQGAGCPEPRCTKIDAGGGKSDGGGGGAGCSELQACCDKLSGVEKQGCDAAVKHGDQSICSQALQGYKNLGRC